MRFYWSFFIVFGIFGVVGGARAVDGCTQSKQLCPDGKYNKYGCQTNGLFPVAGYSCISCPVPFNKSGTSSPQDINDCYVELSCEGNACSIYYDGRVDCNGGPGNYHAEMINNVATCIENTRACSVFDIGVAYGAWTCSKNSQTGSAQWTPSQNAWDTGGCTCSIVDKDIEMDAGNTIIKCKKANADYYVANADKYRTKKVSDQVYYTPKRKYCMECYPGKIPNVIPTPSDGVWNRPDDIGNWGAWRCGQDVYRPQYADGCIIDFSIPSWEAAIGSESCVKTCPAGFETEANGATSISDCVSQYTETYEDDTGTFVLTSLDSCP